MSDTEFTFVDEDGPAPSRVVDLAATPVRELAPEECEGLDDAATGEVLSDGSVLLWRDDMDRMGLDETRRWILHQVIQERATISVGARRGHTGVAPLGRPIGSPVRAPTF